MRKAAVKKASREELVAAYLGAAAAHGEATESGDDKAANKQADIIARIYVELRERGEPDVLLPLLEDENRSPR